MKKLMSIILVVVVSISILSIPNTSYAYTTHTQAEAIQWVKSKVGQYLDVDGAYGAQCVDLIKAYYSYLGVSPVSGNAVDYTWNSLPSGWQRIQGATPRTGDILVYGASSGNPYGHVGIYESDYSTFHQNVSGSAVKQVTWHYNGFSNPYWGVIRPDFTSVTPVEVSWGYDDCQPDSSNAYIYTRITANKTGSFTGAGLNVWDENGSKIVQLGESANWNTPYLEIWYNITNDAGVRLKSGSYYTYQFYADFDGVRYYGPIKNFWTTGQKQNAWGSSLIMNNWTYGNSPSSPMIVAKYGTPQYTYSSSYYGTYTSVRPQNAGTYYVKAKVNATSGYTGLETIKAFTITPRSLSKGSVVLGESDNTYTYTGKERKPAVKSVTVAGKKLVYNRDYTVSYKNNKSIGVGTVIIKGKGNYTGTLNKEFKIVPKKVSLKAATAASATSSTITWNKISHASGYQVVVATNKSFTQNKKVVNIKSYKTVKTTISKLKSRKAYYVKVCAYKTVNGKKYYGAYSSVKLVTPKKATVSKVKSTSKKKATVTWKKDSYASGYQIVVATNKGFTKNKKTTTVSSYKTVKKIISNLKSKKTYYVKVRAYKTVSGKKYYGTYSSVKKVKVK